MKHIHRIALLLALSASLAAAADKKPKEMKPKLVDAGTILVKDAFDKEVVDTKWVSEAKADEVGLRIEDGALRVDGPSGGTRGLVETKFTAPVKDVHVQFLL
ncbi:MAG: hypothetical protein ACK5TH_09625, partial [Prosthecobacter sp.]